MNELQALQLKYDGLLQRVASQASRYEDEIAELRVQFTVAMNELERLSQEGNNVSEEAAPVTTAEG